MVTVFGRFSVRREDEVELHFPTARCAQIIARLALEPGGTMGRAALAAELWPETDAERQATSLRTALSHLRKVIGDEAVMSSRAAVSLERDHVQVDFDQAEELVKLLTERIHPASHDALLLRLSDLCDPTLLDQWEEQWIDRHRRVWRERWVRALHGLQISATQAEDWEGVVGYCDRVLARVPYDEASIARAIRADQLRGDTRSATQRYRRAELDVRMALGRAPSQAVTLAAEGIQTGSTLVRGDSLLGTAMEAWLASAPDEALTALNSMMYSPTGNRSPAESHAIMERALSATSGTGPARLRSAAVCAWFAMQSEALADCDRWNQFVLDHTPPSEPAYISGHNRQGVIAYYQGKLERSRERHGVALKLAQEQGNLFMELISILNLRNIDLLEGVHAGVSDELQRLATRARSENMSQIELFLPPLGCVSAYAHLLEGRYARAEQLARQAIAHSESAGVSNYAAEARTWLSLALAFQGRPATEPVAEAMELCEKFGYVLTSERAVRVAAAVANQALWRSTVDHLSRQRGFTPFPSDLVLCDRLRMLANTKPAPTSRLALLKVAREALTS